MKKIKISKLSIILSLLLLFILMIYNLGLASSFINNILAIILMALCIYNMYRSRNNILFFILHFQLFYYNYSVVFSRYLHVVDQYYEFYKNVNIETLNIGIICLCIFEIFMTFFSYDVKPFKSENIYAVRKNEFISILLLFASFFVGILGFDWSNYGNRFSITSYYEYIGILLILGLHYSGFERSKLIKYGYSLLILGLIIQGLVYGERVSALQFIFIWTFYFIGEKIKTRNLFLLSLFGIFLMSFIGVYRGSYDLSFINISTIFDSLSQRLLTFDGSDLGYYASLTFVMVAKKVSLGSRYNMFIKLLISIFVGNSSEANLGSFTRQYYAHFFGGYYPLHFYFYGGISMVIFFCWLWSSLLIRCLKRKSSKHTDFKYLLGLYLVCICARWYMYTPLNAFRSILIFSICYFLLYIFNNRRHVGEENE